MEWIPIILFILLGLALVIAEIIFIPGTTIVGVCGVISLGYGVFLSFSGYGNTVGIMTLVATSILMIIFLYWSFRNKSWERFSLKNTISGKVNDDFSYKPAIGDKGKSISSLKPIGKAAFGDNEIEVSSNGGYINENVEIVVLRIEGQKVIVQTL